MLRHILAVCVAALTTAVMLPAVAEDALTRAIQLAATTIWNQPQPPVRIHGDTYYVGVAGLSSILIHTDEGLILLDGDLPQSVPLIEKNIATLGFRVKDIRFILNSHAHFDHAGGIAALARDSGAVVVASPAGAAALRAGRATPDDPQAGYADATRADPATFPAVMTKIREIRDGETLRLGKIAVIAHFTPGHTPGSTTWTWRDCDRDRCLDVVYADSLNAISAPGFHFLADATHADLTASFRKSIQLVGALPCDILLTVHPDLSDLPQKLQRVRAGAATNPFVDARACRDYARDAEAKLDARIREEQTPASH
jgi:metallo-beta-lactamase class B